MNQESLQSQIQRRPVTPTTGKVTSKNVFDELAYHRHLLNTLDRAERRGQLNTSLAELLRSEIKQAGDLLLVCRTAEDFLACHLRGTKVASHLINLLSSAKRLVH